MVDSQDRDDVLLHASGRTTSAEAVLWFAEGHPLQGQVAPQAVIGALLAMPDGTTHLDDALRAVVREASTSTLDPSSVLFNIEAIHPPGAVRQCLDSLAAHSPSGSIAGLTPSSVVAALQDAPASMDVLALIAGLTPKELRRRLGDEAPRGQTWTLRQVKAALGLVTSIIEGTAVSPVTGARPARPVEMIFNDNPALAGWAGVAARHYGGVPYEVLLTQRAVGSAWQNHRNSTSSALGVVITSELCAQLDLLGTTYLRSTAKGGTDDLTQVSTIGKVVAVMTRPDPGQEPWSVIVSIANDTGTANKTAAQLCDLVAGEERVAVLLAGPGWAERLPETTDLARQVRGHIYTEQDIPTLAQVISVTPAPYLEGVER